MKSHMKIDEVFEAYPDEWVLLDELESQAHHQPLSHRRMQRANVG